MSKIKKIDEYLQAHRDHSYFIAATLKAAVDIERIEQEMLCDGDMVAILKDGGVYDWNGVCVSIIDGKIVVDKISDDAKVNATSWWKLEEQEQAPRVQAELAAKCDEEP